MIQAQIEEEMLKRKDHRWEDVADVSNFATNMYAKLTSPFLRTHTSNYPSRSLRNTSSMSRHLVGPTRPRLPSGTVRVGCVMVVVVDVISTGDSLECDTYHHVHMTPLAATRTTALTWNVAGDTTQMTNLPLVRMALKNMIGS